MAGTWERTGHPGIEKQRKPNGDWRYRARFRDARGKVTSRTFDRLRDAKDFLGDIRIRRRTNTLPDTSGASRSLQEFWEYFSKTHEAEVKPSTWASYEHRWRNHIQPVLGHHPLGSLPHSVIEDFYAKVERDTSRDTRSARSSRSST